MKKLLVVLLSLGLIAAFSMPASAADVKFTGSYYVGGAYDNNPLLQENSYSQAYMFQQVRIKPVFQVAEGLTFTTRFDALEKQWGDTRWVTGTSDKNSGRLGSNAAVGIAENIEFEQAYVTFNTALGTFQVGYMDANAWGTAYGNNPGTAPGVSFQRKFGDFTMGLAWEHVYDNLLSSNVAIVDGDNDTYAVSGTYKKGGIEAGLLFKNYINKNTRPASNYAANMYLLSPYAKMTFGPVYVEAEVNYMFGKYRKYESPSTTADLSSESWSAYINGNYKIGPATVGALFAIVTGQDYSTDKFKAVLNGGYAWNPALMLMNGDLKWWGGNGHSAALNARTYLTGKAGQTTLTGDTKGNTVWYNMYASYAVTPKLLLGTAITYATVENKKLSATTEAVSDKLGTEWDVTASYKIFDNLTYMVGAGYLWAGDYFKGSDATTKVENNYVLVNKLTLNF